MGFGLYWRRFRLQRNYDLAVRYFEQDNLPQAERRAVKAFRALQGMGRPSTLTVPLVCLLAQIYKKSGNDLAAGRIFRVAVELLRKCYGDGSIKVGVALHGLGVTLSRAGLPERAIEALEEAIPILEKVSGQDHSDVAAALSNLGLAQSQAKRYTDAEQTQRRVIAMREAKLGLDDPEVAAALNNLSVTYKRQERIPEAVDCLRRALAIREAKLGPGHPNVGLVLNNLGNCLRLERHYDEAEAALTRAKLILENPPHKSFATVLDSLAGLRADQGRYEEAEKYYLDA
jgi:Tfp pilus assembly protein PilF